jgi:membrane-associated phospholipid phosphatase
VAFASYAALLAWPATAFVVIGLLLVLGVAWSRLVLGRHTPRDVVAGALAGLLAGGLFLA